MMATTTHDRRTHDLPTRMLSTAQACEAEAATWDESFVEGDRDEWLAVARRVSTHLRVLAANYRLNRQLYIDGALSTNDCAELTTRAMSQTRRQVEQYENDRLSIVAALMEPSA